MTVDYETMLLEFAEFGGATRELVEARIAEAYRRTPERIWGDLRDDGAKYLAAHLIALSPFAAELKLVGPDRKTLYGEERARLERLVSSGFRVTGTSWPL
jgi:hypothetical protein